MKFLLETKVGKKNKKNTIPSRKYYSNERIQGLVYKEALFDK
jgi:hypothetical protein